LNNRIAPGAAFDSFQRQSASKCLENTHQEVIAQISTWADDVDQPSICWVSGPAGAGKSTIAQTIAELYAGQTNEEYPKGRLAASFFFSRGNKDLCAARFFPTIAYHLAISLPRIQKGMEMALKDDPSIVSKRLEVQFMKLILDPIDTCIQSQPMIVVIDGLDECEGEGSKELIRVLARTIGELYRGTHFPLRFLITSRADDHIERVLNQYTSLSYRLSLDEFRDDHEIRASLADRVSKLYQSDAHPVRRVPQPGPSDLGLNAHFEKAPTNTRALRVLSLDGGGFRGKASLLILDSLMRAVSAKIGGQPVKPCQYFDLIAGTSTGGLVALMLGRLGYSTEEAIAKYTECVSCIFDRVGSNKTWIAAGFPKVDKRPLEHLLKKIGHAGGRDAELLEDPATSTPHCRVIVRVTCTRHSTSDPVPVFRHHHSSECARGRTYSSALVSITSATHSLWPQVEDLGGRPCHVCGPGLL
jgi:energy-coupling factor transporter ATP-binding protein EcfA2